MMETHPWAGSVLTISQLVLLKQVMVVDCTLPTPLILMSRPRSSWRAIAGTSLTRRSPCQYFNPKTLRITRQPSTSQKLFERQDTAESCTAAKLAMGRTSRCSMSMRLKSQAGSFDEPRSYRLPSLKLVQFPMKNNTETNSKRVNKSQKPEPTCDLEADVLCGR
jgi:hypothetical protein